MTLGEGTLGRANNKCQDPGEEEQKDPWAAGAVGQGK